MATLASLVVKVSGDTGQLISSLETAEKRSKKFGMNVSQAIKATGVAMTALGGAISAVGLTSIKSFVEAGGAIDDLAQRTGMGVTTLSELKFAAEQSGASLNDMERIVRNMQRTIVDAADGSNTAQAELKGLGLAADDLAGKSPDEQFDRMAMALADIEDPARRTSLAFDIFGRAGTSLLPMLSGGAEGLQAMKDRAHELGVVFDQEGIDATAEFEEAMYELGQSMEGVKHAIAAAIIPTLTSMIDNVTRVVANVQKWRKENPELFATIVKIVGVIGGLSLVLGPLLLMLPGIAAGVALVGGAFTLLTGPIGIAGLVIVGLIAGGLLLIKNWEHVADVGRDAFRIVGDAVEFMANSVFIPALNAIISGVNLVRKVVGQDAIDSIQKLEIDGGARFDGLSDKVLSFRTRTEKLLNEVKGVFTGHSKATGSELDDIGAKAEETAGRVAQYGLAVDHALTPMAERQMRMQGLTDGLPSSILASGGPGASDDMSGRRAFAEAIREANRAGVDLFEGRKDLEEQYGKAFGAGAPLPMLPGQSAADLEEAERRGGIARWIAATHPGTNDYLRVDVHMDGRQVGEARAEAAMAEGALP